MYCIGLRGIMLLPCNAQCNAIAEQSHHVCVYFTRTRMNGSSPGGHLHDMMLIRCCRRAIVRMVGLTRGGIIMERHPWRRPARRLRVVVDVVRESARGVELRLPTRGQCGHGAVRNDVWLARRTHDLP